MRVLAIFVATLGSWNLVGLLISLWVGASEAAGAFGLGATAAAGVLAAIARLNGRARAERP